VSTTEIKAPFAVGDRVRLARPENPNHPRAGRVGTVVQTRWWDERVGRRGVIENAVWMAVVRFDPDGQADEFDRLGVGDQWRLFEGELVNERGGVS
jgi:hypothetical protein